MMKFKYVVEMAESQAIYCIWRSQNKLKEGLLHRKMELSCVSIVTQHVMWCDSDSKM